MAYTFSKIDAASLTIEDVRPLIESSFQQMEQNMKFPVEDVLCRANATTTNLEDSVCFCNENHGRRSAHFLQHR
jgi:hypothetical protein